jgi:hypothetical protein
VEEVHALGRLVRDLEAHDERDVQHPLVVQQLPRRKERKEEKEK